MSSFNEAQFEKKLHTLKDSQESIQNLSSWCLTHRHFHKKIVSTWLRVLKKVKIEHRLTLFYLANDVVQYSKRKNYEFVESWGTALQRATTMVREEKVKNKILRIFRIWDERGIYDEAFISDLSGLLSTSTKKPIPESSIDFSDFQPSNLIAKIRCCKKLEDDTDVKFKRVKDSHLALNDADALRQHLKDRRQGDDIVAEVDEGVGRVQGYVKALELEIKDRSELIELLEQGQAFYETQKGEAKVVANAYRNFGVKVKNLKRRLDELIPTLKELSPIPSPPNVEDAPSPSPDSDADDMPALNPTAPEPMYVNSYAPPPPPQPIRTVMQEEPSAKPAAAVAENFSSFIGNALPFDVQKNLFSESRGEIVSPSPEPEPEDPGGSPGPASEGKPIEVISSRTKPEEAFSIADFLKSLIPTRTETIPGLSDSTEPPANAELTKPYSEPASALSNLSQSSTEFEFPTVTTASTPLQPPPMPPNLFPLEDSSSYKYGQTQEAEDSWNTKLPPKFPTWGDTTNSTWGETSEPTEKVSEWMPVMPVNKVPPVEIVDTPESPPMYEKEGFSDPVEYDDSIVEPTIIPNPSDIDHRTLVPLPLANHNLERVGPHREEQMEDTDHRLLMHIQSTNHIKKDVDHRPLIHRKKDVDHRNLISLTGSPMRESHAPLAPPPTPPTLPWPRVDQDYRSQVPRKTKSQDVMNEDDMDFKSKGPKCKDETQDNVESVDMEMSDDEGVDPSEGVFITKTETTPITNMNTDSSESKLTISFNINTPTKILSNSPLNEIKEDLSRPRNRVYGCQKIPTIGGGIQSPRMMRGGLFPPPGVIPRLRMPNTPQSLRASLLNPPPPPPPPPPVSQFNSVRIRPIADLIHLSQEGSDVQNPERSEEKMSTPPPPPPVLSVASAIPAVPLGTPVLPGQPGPPVPGLPVNKLPDKIASPDAGGSSQQELASPDSVAAGTEMRQLSWTLNQEQKNSNPASLGNEKEAQNIGESDVSNAKKWTPTRSGPEANEPWMNDNILDFEVREVERLNSFDRTRGRGRGGANFNKHFTMMPPTQQGSPRGGFNPRGLRAWGPRRGVLQVPPPPPPPPPPRFPFRTPLDSFRGPRGAFRPPFRGAQGPRHFGGW